MIAGYGFHFLNYKVARTHKLFTVFASSIVNYRNLQKQNFLLIHIKFLNEIVHWILTVKNQCGIKKESAKGSHMRKIPEVRKKLPIFTVAIKRRFTSLKLRFKIIVEMATSMEVDTDNTSVMAPAGTPGSVTIALHPLVIMNISEHWTRIRAQNDGKPQQGRTFDLNIILSKFLIF